MFAEDIDLLPAGTVQSIVNNCLEYNQSPFDLFGSLFRQMNSPKPAPAGRFKGRLHFGTFSNFSLFGRPRARHLLRLAAQPLSKNDGTLEKAASMANRASTRTTQFMIAAATK
jgi:hypothetical protein